MAETVHRRLEDLLPVFEELHNCDILAEKEVKNLIKKSTSYEYRLARVQKSKEDFTQYAMYKINLLKLIKARRHKLQYYFKKDKIEYVIVSTIHGLLTRCTIRWPADLKLWMTHVKFSESWNKNHQLSKIWSNVLKFHANKPHLWVMAAQFEVRNNNFQNARSLFFRALRHHPKNKQMWLQYFRMEVISISKMRERMNTIIGKDDLLDRVNASTTDEAIMKGAIAKLVYDNAKNARPNDAKFCCRFIEILLPFLSYVKDLAQTIIDDISKHFDHDAYARSTLAKIYIHPIYYNRNDIETDLPSLESLSFSAFEQAIQDVDTSEMYDEYIDFLFGRISVNADKDVANTNVMKFNPVDMKNYHQRLNELALRAFSKGKLSNQSCLKFTEFLVQNGNIDQAVQILKKVKDRKSNAGIHIKFTELKSACCSKENYESLVREFVEITKKFDNLSEDNEKKLWYLWLNVCDVVSSADVFTNLLAHAVMYKSKFVPEIKIRFLRWSALNANLEETKKLFANTLENEGQMSPDVYTEMVHILEKSAESSTHLSDIMKYYESAINKYGEVDVDLWLDYIRFATNHFPMKVGDIHWKATKALNPDGLQNFHERYSVINM